MGILRYAVPPLGTGVDNAEMVRGWQSGTAYCCALGRDGADLRRKIWTLLRDMGEEGSIVFKVKAHVSVEDAEVGLLAWCDWRCNEVVDRLAVQGAVLAERKAPREPGDSQLKRALRFYRWAAERAADWREDTDKDRGGHVEEGTGGVGQEAHKGGTGGEPPRFQYILLPPAAGGGVCGAAKMAACWFAEVAGGIRVTKRTRSR